MKTNNTSAKGATAETVKNNENTVNRTNTNVLTQEQAFESLLFTFRAEVSMCKTLKGVPDNVVNQIAHSLLCSAVTAGWYEPEMPAGFKNVKKEVRAAMERAKAAVFAIHFQENAIPVSSEDDKKIVSALLNIREEMEEEYRERTGLCPYCGHKHCESDHGEEVA